LHVKIHLERTIGSNTAFPGAWCVHGACVHLGLAGGHAALVAEGWQSSLADEGIIHVAPLAHYNISTQLSAYGQHFCAADSSPTFGETLCLLGQMVGNNLSAVTGKKSFAGHLSLCLSCPWTCQNLCIGQSGVWLAACEAGSTCTAALRLKHRCERVWEPKLPFG